MCLFVCVHVFDEYHFVVTHPKTCHPHSCLGNFVLPIKASATVDCVDYIEIHANTLKEKKKGQAGHRKPV